MINSLCILGGGTSGLVSALILRKGWPDLKITIIESSKLGIIGVGEGSTEHWKNFIQHVDITVLDLIRETGATFKMGIKFTNWHGDNTHYFHSLSEQWGGISRTNGVPFTFAKQISENVDPLETAWHLSKSSRHIEPLHDILSQYHFDTYKLNKFLHKKCIERNIKIIDTEVIDVILDHEGYVKSLLDCNNKKHSYDFYIDCSGFQRVIGSKLGTKWVDRSEQLPMNSAIAFPTGYIEEIPSYTESTALSSGWCWRIPTQERFGNGYVFCNDFINETQAYDEVQRYYSSIGINDSIEIGRTFKFKAGYVDKFWIKNCVMVGLSGVFVEPLEASSIGTTIQQMFILVASLFYYDRTNNNTANRYNTHMIEISENIIDFIQLHYFTQREDTDFWKWCKHNIKLTDFNSENLEHFKNDFVNAQYFGTPMVLFSQLNWIQVMHGLRLFNIERLKEKYNTHMSKIYTPIVNNIMEEDKEFVRNRESFPHRIALNMIKERYNEIKIQL